MSGWPTVPRAVFPFLVAPLITDSHAYPFRVPYRFAGKVGHVVLHQVRTVDQEGLARRLLRLAPATVARVLAVLQEMFAP